MDDKLTITISDPTLRDGNHAVGHQIMPLQVETYCRLADAAGVPIVEVGHGNGLGASSLNIGVSAAEDREILAAARKALAHSRLGVHVIPGYATIEKDLKPAIDLGVDVFRIASHVTEADLCERHIGYVKKQNRTAYGVLMMSHMAGVTQLVEEARKLERYGADSVVIMDSAGNYLMGDVKDRIRELASNLSIPVGFHAHNNLGLAVANSVSAADHGASIIDGTARGFGAGAGNTPIEVLVAVLERMGYRTGIDLDKLFLTTDYAAREIMAGPQVITPVSVVSGIAGVFSGFAKPVARISKTYGVSPLAVFHRLGERRVVAGQEDLIVEVAQELAAGR